MRREPRLRLPGEPLDDALAFPFAMAGWLGGLNRFWGFRLFSPSNRGRPFPKIG